MATGMLGRVGQTVVVITAGHCLYDIYNQTVNHEFVFNCSLGQFHCVTGLALQQWVKKAEPEYDVAVLYPEGDFNELLIPELSFDFTKKGLNAEYLIPQRSWLKIQHWKAFSKIVVEPETLYGSTLLGFRKQLQGGMSGTPVFTEKNGKLMVAGVISLSFRQRKGMLWFAQYDQKYLEILSLNQSNCRDCVKFELSA